MTELTDNKDAPPSGKRRKIGPKKAYLSRMRSVNDGDTSDGNNLDVLANALIPNHQRVDSLSQISLPDDLRISFSEIEEGSLHLDDMDFSCSPSDDENVLDSTQMNLYREKNLSEDADLQRINAAISSTSGIDSQPYARSGADCDAGGGSAREFTTMKTISEDFLQTSISSRSLDQSGAKEKVSSGQEGRLLSQVSRDSSVNQSSWETVSQSAWMAAPQAQDPQVSTVGSSGQELEKKPTVARRQSKNKHMDNVSCQVCGDVAAGFYCGAFICEACKKFYMRAYKQDKLKYVCLRDKQCIITKESRVQCQYCRFQKCVSLNMYCPKQGETEGKDRSMSEIPCRVCAAPSSGFHFGAITCEGCKGFFRRMAKEREPEKYQCNKKGSCEINMITRNLCKACRYKKCVSAGMSVEGSRIGRQPNSVKHAISMELKNVKPDMSDDGMKGFQVKQEPLELTEMCCEDKLSEDPAWTSWANKATASSSSAAASSSSNKSPVADSIWSNWSASQTSTSSATPTVDKRKSTEDVAEWTEWTKQVMMNSVSDKATADSNNWYNWSEKQSTGNEGDKQATNLTHSQWSNWTAGQSTAKSPVKSQEGLSSWNTVSGKQIPNMSGKQIPNVSGKQIPNVTGKHIPNMSGKQIPNVTGKQIPNMTGKQIPNVTGKQIPNVTGKQIPNVSGKQIPNTIGKDISNLSQTRTSWNTVSSGKQIPNTIGKDINNQISSMTVSSGQTYDENFMKPSDISQRKSSTASSSSSSTTDSQFSPQVTSATQPKNPYNSWAQMSSSYTAHTTPDLSNELNLSSPTSSGPPESGPSLSASSQSHPTFPLAATQPQSTPTASSSSAISLDQYQTSATFSPTVSTSKHAAETSSPRKPAAAPVVFPQSSSTTKPPPFLPKIHISHHEMASSCGIQPNTIQMPPPTPTLSRASSWAGSQSSLDDEYSEENIKEFINGIVEAGKCLQLLNYRVFDTDLNPTTSLKVDEIKALFKTKYMDPKAGNKITSSVDFSIFATRESTWNYMMTNFHHNTYITIRFAKMVPGFKTLCLNDQVKLIQSSIYPIEVLNMSIVYDGSTKCYNFFTYTKEEEAIMMEQFPMLRVFQEHFRHVGEMVTAFKFTDEEFALLSALLLFPAEIHGLENPKAVEALQSKISYALQYYEEKTFPDGLTRYEVLLVNPYATRGYCQPSVNSVDPDQMASNSPSDHETFPDGLTRYGVLLVRVAELIQCLLQHNLAIGLLLTHNPTIKVPQLFHELIIESIKEGQKS